MTATACVLSISTPIIGVADDTLPQTLPELMSLASHGDARAQNQLGVIYSGGAGVKKDLVEADRWFGLAANQGYLPAEESLALGMLSSGDIHANPTLAYFWCARAALQAASDDTLPKAWRDLAVICRDEAARKVEPAEAERIAALAAQWKPGVDVVALIGPPVAAQNPLLQRGARGSLNPAGGSGFLVNRDRFVLTTAHAVADCKEITVEPSGRGRFHAKLVTRSADADLALLKFDSPNIYFPDIAAFREDPQVHLKDEVDALGTTIFGASTSITIGRGKVDALTGPGNDNRLFQVSGTFWPSVSGGPMLDTSGNVVGVALNKIYVIPPANVSDANSRTNFAVTAYVARQFLDLNHIAYVTAKSDRAMAPFEVEKAARPFSVAVDCKL